jgi:hypothetical protein
MVPTSVVIAEHPLDAPWAEKKENLAEKRPRKLSAQVTGAENK